MITANLTSFLAVAALALALALLLSRDWRRRRAHERRIEKSLAKESAESGHSVRTRASRLGRTRAVSFPSRKAMVKYLRQNRTLTELAIDDCSSLRSVPEMPGSLERLWVQNCDALTDLSALPRWPTHVMIRYCPGVAPEGLAPSVSYYVN